MSTNAKAYAATVQTWLRNNLGKHCLGVCTGNDFRALRSAVQIADLWGGGDFDNRANAATAFRLVVISMQPEARELAFHAIAHPLDWSHRFELWRHAGLPPFERLRVCKYGPAEGTGTPGGHRLFSS